MKFIYFLQKFSRNLFYRVSLQVSTKKEIRMKKKAKENDCLYGGIDCAWNGDNLYLSL